MSRTDNLHHTSHLHCATKRLVQITYTTHHTFTVLLNVWYR